MILALDCEADQAAALVAGTNAQDFYPRMDGGEMWSRWDMQDDPPDILITNYVMLNIMLMRAFEETVFQQTRDWLAEDDRRVFYLVVDELHSYRGTAGTEVGYLLRVFLDRIGLLDRPDQLRVIASSASLSSGSEGLAYLENFFGRSRSRFTVISGNIVPPDDASRTSVRGAAAALATLGSGLRSPDPAVRTTAAQAFQQAIAPLTTQQTTCELALHEGLSHLNAADAIRLGCRIPPRSCEGTLAGTVTGAARTSLSDGNAAFYTAGTGLAGLPVLIEQGTGAGQSNVILFNTAQELTLKYRWDTVPDQTSRYRITPQLPPKPSQHIAAELFPPGERDRSQRSGRGSNHSARICQGRLRQPAIVSPGAYLHA